MNAMRCQYETEMIRAIETGECSESLMAHQKNCAACREAVMLAQMLRRDASELATRYVPPSSERVWWVAERHRQMAALARATRFLRLLKIAGLAYSAVIIVWVLHVLTERGVGASWIEGKSVTAVIEGAGLAVLFVASGLWYTLRVDRRRVG